MTNSCGSGTANFWINVVQLNVSLNANTELCLGDSVFALANGADAYTWLPSEWVVLDNNNSAILIPSQSDSLVVIGNNALGCSDRESIWINVLPLPNLSLEDSITFDYPDAVQIPIVSNIPTGQWEPTHYLSCDTCAQTMADPIIPTLYQFSVADDAGCGASDSIWVVPLFPFWVPNTFTPNNDQINDGFGVVSRTKLDNFAFRVFDRWGGLVFFTNDQNKRWDGSFNGYFVPQDAYVWELQFKLPEGDQLYRGHVTILR
jgi:gliding motility-associated-like protein